MTYIYKYCNQASIKIFENGTIRVNPIPEFNDPFEMKVVFTSFELEKIINDKNINDGVDIALEEKKTRLMNCKDMGELKRFLKDISNKFPLPIEVYQKLDFLAQKGYSLQHLKDMILQFLPITKTISMLSVSNCIEENINKWDHELVTKLQYEYDKYLNNFGALCFTSKSDNLLMWAHYAEQHKGFVIEFNRDHKFFKSQRSDSDEFYHLRPVKYDDKRPNHSINNMNGMAMFLTKSLEWKYEDESRILFPLQLHEKKDDMYLIPLPPESITRIILGCRAWEKENDQKSFADKLIKTIKEKPQYSHVEIKTAVLDESEYKLNIKDVLKRS